jgi:ABC-type branched-subunit amino acid transport system ATPase component
VTSDAAIHVRGLEKSYKELRVLRGVDFDVARGSIFALLGSNGAGKTTVVNILSTLLKADAGTTAVNGFDVATQAAEVRESISLTGQFAAVDEILSGRENLLLAPGRRQKLWIRRAPEGHPPCLAAPCRQRRIAVPYIPSSVWGFSVRLSGWKQSSAYSPGGSL